MPCYYRWLQVIKLIIDTRKLASIKNRPNSLILHLPTKFVKEAGFNPNDMVQVIFDDLKKEIKIVKKVRNVEV